MISKITVLDLFCWCWGLSYWFSMSWYDVLLWIDNWKDCLDTFAYNHKNAKILCADISKIGKDDVQNILWDKRIDIIVWWPPCQWFSLAWKRDSKDPRNKLVIDYVKIISEIRPKFFVMENVLWLLSMKDEEWNLVIENLKNEFWKIWYNINYKLLYAHNYWVPQKRWRVFIVWNNIWIDFKFPEIKNDWIKVPFVTVWDAISDLPLLDNDFWEEKTKYIQNPKSEYQKFIRKDSQYIFNHTKSNHSEQTIKVINLVPEWWNRKDLPPEYQNIRSFSNTRKRLDSKQPSVTIDTWHRHHFHYKANRVPTVRESARIQSFPDTFEFKWSRTSQFKQVWNAVPPLLAKAIADEIKKYL